MTQVYSALSPVSAGLYTALNVSAVTTLALGGVCDDVPPAPVFPFVLFDLSETFDGGFGTRPGQNGSWRVNLRLHVYSQKEGWKEARAILGAAIAQIVDPITVDGMTCHAVFHDQAIQAPDQIIAGQKCKELAHDAHLFVEAA